MSKAYGLPGLRIGWLACKDRSLLLKLERYKHYLSICNSATSEVLARIALKARDTLLTRNRQVVDHNLAALDVFFDEHAHLFDWHRPDGSCVGFVRYKGPEGVEDFARRLVEESSVLLLPASVFRSELNDVPSDYFRLGYGHSNVPQGLEVMRGWLQRTGR